MSHQGHIDLTQRLPSVTTHYIQPARIVGIHDEYVDRARPARPQVPCYSLRLCQIPRHQEQSRPILRVSPSNGLRDAGGGTYDEDSLNHWVTRCQNRDINRGSRSSSIRCQAGYAF